MPEGPEHFNSALFINKCCDDHVFSGKIVKSDVNHKNPEINCNFDHYLILAKARGKELMLTLVQNKPDEKDSSSGIKIKREDEHLEPTSAVDQMKIVFQFGMSGCFRFTNTENLPKHSHLRFFRTDGMVLSYVDVRRFGKWRVSSSFSEDRGPDPVFEYTDFRANILNNINKRIFQKSICEVLHNQMFFNGIGNYLRAEILFRAKISPFSTAYDLLKDLECDKKEPPRKKRKNSGDFDLLEWCTLIPFEVMMLEGGGYDASYKGSNYSLFENWLQCYYKDGMNNMVDHDGRTIWFQGEAGPLAPTGGKAKSRHKRKNGSDTNIKDTKKSNKGKVTVKQKQPNKNPSDKYQSQSNVSDTPLARGRMSTKKTDKKPALKSGNVPGETLRRSSRIKKSE